MDLALWEIKGKALGVPVYELLGGRARDRVVSYPHNKEAGTDTSALVESCLKTKEEGWRFVRWGLPQDGEVFDPRRSVLAAVKQLAAPTGVILALWDRGYVGFWIWTSENVHLLRCWVHTGLLHDLLVC